MRKIFGKMAVSTLLTALLATAPVFAPAQALAAANVIRPAITTARVDLPLTAGYTLLAWTEADLTGDGVPEVLFLEGRAPQEGSAFAEDIRIRALEPATGKTKDYADDIEGYAAEIYIEDFTGDGVPEVMAVIETGGTGGIVLPYVIDFKSSKPVALLTAADDSLGVALKSAGYLDDYWAELVFKFNKLHERTYIIDLVGNKEMYDDPAFGVYDGDGKLLNEVEPFIIPYGSAVPYRDQAAPQLMRIEFTQRISGVAQYDTIATLVSRIEYRDGKFELAYAELVIPAYGEGF